MKRIITIDLDSNDEFEVFISEENSSGSKYKGVKNKDDLKTVINKYIDDNFNKEEW